MQRLTLKNIINLAAPHTWVASVFPVLLGSLLSVAMTGRFLLSAFFPLLAASVLLQSSVNTLNDYYDFIRGTDRLENSDEPDDAVLVYGNIDPKYACRLGIAFMAAALLCGIYPALLGGPVTLGLGAFGCLVIIAYSAGRHPISHLPLGEFVSGFVMGTLITVAVFSAYNHSVRAEVFLLSLPLMLAIWLIMMTNNSCDIERDSETGRRTLPLLLGRRRARLAYRLLVALWVLSIPALMLLYFPRGALVSSAAMLLCIPILIRLFRAKLIPQQRGPCMRDITKANLGLGCAYLIGIVAEILLR